MNKQKPEWAKGDRLWEGFVDDNMSKLDDVYRKLFGEEYSETVIDYWAEPGSYYALLPKGRVEGFEKVDKGRKYFYSLNPTYIPTMKLQELITELIKNHSYDENVSLASIQKLYV